MPITCSRRVLALCVVALLLSLVASFRSADAQDLGHQGLTEATITMTGTASIDASPDIAFIRAGAVTEGTNARLAMQANSKILSDAMASLAELGVLPRDIQTSELSITPRYTYFDSSNGQRRPPRIDGYSVSNQLTVRIRDLEGIGETLDALISAGVNQMGGLNFAVDEPEALFQQARAQAVRNARAEAEAIVEAAGVSLGRIITIQQDFAQQAPIRPQMARMAADAAVAEAIPVAPGEQEISARVRIVWALNQ